MLEGAQLVILVTSEVVRLNNFEFLLRLRRAFKKHFTIDQVVVWLRNTWRNRVVTFLLFDCVGIVLVIPI